jgi:hypothetical protein
MKEAAVEPGIGSVHGCRLCSRCGHTHPAVAPVGRKTVQAVPVAAQDEHFHQRPNDWQQVELGAEARGDRTTHGSELEAYIQRIVGDVLRYHPTWKPPIHLTHFFSGCQ